MNKIKCTITPKTPLYGILAGPIRKKTDIELSKEQIIRCINNNAIITTNIEGKQIRISINNAAEILEKALSSGISKPIIPASREENKQEEVKAPEVPQDKAPEEPKKEDVKTPEPEKKEEVKQPEPEKKAETPAPEKKEEVKKDNKPFDKKQNKQDKKNEQNSKEETYTESDAEKFLNDTLEEIEIQEMIDKDKK